MRPVQFKALACGWILLLVLFDVSYSQSADPVRWRDSELRSLQKQLGETTTDPLRVNELDAQIRWLKQWSPGSMTATPKPQTKLPLKRQEPILESPQATQLRDSVSNLDEEQAFKKLRTAWSQHKSDVGCLQAILHWMDDEPTQRKKYLDEIEQLTGRISGLLEASIEERADEKLRIALDFIRYRRARALVYRELPDVVAVGPIADQAELNRRIEQAYEELFKGSGEERTEFILLKIRMDRRSGNFGQALEMLEKYGPTILPKWYQKKRRDLLKELDWEHPYREAAAIYLQNFPEEVEKERKRRSNSQQRECTTNSDSACGS